MAAKPDLPSLWDRLKNDLAFRVATLYAGGSWFLVEALDTLQLPAYLIQRTALTLAVVFLPVVLGSIVWQRRRARGAQEQAAAPVVSQRRVGVRRWATALTALLVIALGMWAFGTRVSGDVPAAAERIAVMPFHATGPADVREFGVGMVDLLTAALSDVGPIRTVASRTVLARVGSDVGALSLDAVRTAAREVGAASVLTGSITAFENRVHLVAELRDVDSGAVMASAEVRGPQSDMMTLADRLAVALVRELWRSRNPLPSIRTAALTTEVPAALRSWLRGEQHLRATQFDSAMYHFEAAIAADSTFALAWARLAETTGWMTSLSETVVKQREYMQRALAVGDRLPERERALLTAVDLHLRGSFGSFDSLDAYVHRYPEDPMGWYHLGDARFHSQFLGRFDESEIIDPFLEATRLDPLFGMGLAHVIDISLARGDRELFDHSLPLYARFGDAERMFSYGVRARVRWAPADSIITVLARELRALKMPAQRSLVLPLTGILGQRVRLDPMVDPLIYAAAADSIAAIFPDDRALRFAASNRRGWIYDATGRYQAAFRELDALVAAGGAAPGVPPEIFRAVVRISTTLNGGLPAERVANDAALLERVIDDQPAWTTGALAFYYSRTGQAQRARALVPRVVTFLPSGTREVDTAALLESYGGWVELELGDTVGGLRASEAGLMRLGYADANYLGLPWHAYGAVLARTPGREQQGIRMLREHLRVNAQGSGRVYVELARALERTGDRAAARDAWGHALRFLSESDPELEPVRREIVDALSRLATETVR